MIDQMLPYLTQKRDIYARLINSNDIRLHREEVVNEIVATIEASKNIKNIEEKALSMAKCEGMLHAVSFIGETLNALTLEIESLTPPKPKTGEE